LPLADASVDVLTALDVIEHVENDRAAMSEFARVLRSGGMAVISVPALMRLWSDWDATLHHYRRYTKSSLRETFPGEFEILHMNYINVVALPAVYWVRKFRGLKRRLGFKTSLRSEDKIPPPWLNTFLRWLFVRAACQNAVRFPAGVGLLAVLRKQSVTQPTAKLR